LVCSLSVVLEDRCDAAVAERHSEAHVVLVAPTAGFGRQRIFRYGTVSNGSVVRDQ
jgi:hypothetical protein